jgi:predicted RNase H-like nuclease (RuvC/YqgF family)
VLERISSAIDKDIFFFYEIDKDFQGYNKTEISESEYLNALFKAESYEQQLRQQQETISAQKKLIEALEERVKDINVIVQLKENEIYNLKKVTALPEESAECADVG